MVKDPPELEVEDVEDSHSLKGVVKKMADGIRKQIEAGRKPTYAQMKKFVKREWVRLNRDAIPVGGPIEVFWVQLSVYLRENQAYPTFAFVPCRLYESMERQIGDHPDWKVMMSTGDRIPSLGGVKVMVHANGGEAGIVFGR